MSGGQAMAHSPFAVPEQELDAGVLAAPTVSKLNK
jgi:hypothetical protein